jgi:hypothetical protein
MSAGVLLSVLLSRLLLLLLAALAVRFCRKVVSPVLLLRGFIAGWVVLEPPVLLRALRGASRAGLLLGLLWRSVLRAPSRVSY